jgi:hypothetical protein
MGLVIPLRNVNARSDVVEHFESMLAKARCGTVRGWMGVADMESGMPHGIACGTFAEDPERAVKAASKGLEVLLAKSGAGGKNQMPVQDYVPARLRGR